MLAVLFGVLVSYLVQGTVAYKDCEKIEFKKTYCQPSKALNDASKVATKKE